MKSCGCFLFGGEYEARTRDLLHAMQITTHNYINIIL